MNKLLLTLSMFVAISSNAIASSFSKLCEVNAEWKNNSDGKQIAATFNSAGNLSFNDWIKNHLMLVERTLRQRSVENLNASQRHNRLQLLDELNGYWHTGVFPVNDYLAYNNPVFIDRNGTHCAVGYLMQQSGADNLAMQIDADNKFVYVKEIKTKGVAEWATKNGFTIDELAWIQPGYPPTFTTASLENGLNGNVKTMVVDQSTQTLYAGGSFTSSVTGASCNGIAAYISGIVGWSWVGLGAGVNGTVNTLMVHNDKLYVGGQFTMAGSVSASNIAMYDLSTGQWQPMGTLDSTVNTIAVYNNEIYAGGRFTGFVSKWNGSQWQSITAGFIYGSEARTLEVWNNQLLIGGSFELLTGALRRNVATYDGSMMGISGFGTVTPVNDFQVFHDTIYAACDVINGNDTCALARFTNFDWNVIVKPVNQIANYFDGTSIQNLMVADDRLFCAGNFNCGSGMIYGSGIMEFQMDYATNQPLCIPLFIADSTVNTLVNYNNILTFGGDFVYSMAQSLNHTAQLLNIINAVPERSKTLMNIMSIFPNPAHDKISIKLSEMPNQDCFIKIFDQTGRLISTEKIKYLSFTMDMSGNSSGVYMVKIVNQREVTLDSSKVVLR
jgi:hypothetical protein